MPRTRKQPTAPAPLAPQTTLYASVAAFVDTVTATAQPDGTYTALPGSAQSQSMALSPHYGRPLAEMVDACQTMQGFETVLETIDRILADVLATVPAPASVKRVRTIGRRGYAVRPHAVLRGDFAHAWRQTRRASRPQSQHITIAVEAGYPAETSPNTAVLRGACTLALLALLEDAGYRCEVWSVLAGRSPEPTQYPDTTLAVQLKAAGAAWSSHGVACAADPAWLRRLGFRWIEAQPWAEQVTAGYFGVCPLADACTQLEASGALPQVVPGASHTDRITDLPSARTWLKHALARITEREH